MYFGLLIDLLVCFHMDVFACYLFGWFDLLLVLIC